MAKDKLDKLEENLKEHINLKCDPINAHIAKQDKINDQLFSKVNKNKEYSSDINTKVEKVKSSLTTAKVVVGFVLTGILIVLAVLAL